MVRQPYLGHACQESQVEAARFFDHDKIAPVVFRPGLALVQQGRRAHAQAGVESRGAGERLEDLGLAADLGGLAEHLAGESAGARPLEDGPVLLLAG